MRRRRILYAVAAAVLFLTEVIIALFVRDRFIRPYGGDILVTALLCCAVRIFLPHKIRSLPVWVFLFSVCVETAQYFDYASLLGIGKDSPLRIILGSSFAWLDIVCYAAGCVLFAIACFKDGHTGIFHLFVL